MFSMQRSCSSQQFMSNSSAKQTTFNNSSNGGGNGGGGGGGADALQRSSSISNCTIVNKRGFKPSDRFDPAKKEFLLGLSKQIWQRDTPNPGQKKSVDLQKIFTPADDAPVILPQKNRKLYASSAFFAPGFHPTVEDQVELARMISSSLYDSSNVQSKGQSMYVNRKKRSVKWVHEGEGKAFDKSQELTFDELVTPSPNAYFRPPHIQPEAPPSLPPPAPALQVNNHFSPPSPAPFAPSVQFSPQPPVAHYQPPPQPLWQSTQRPVSQNAFTPTIAESPTRQSTTPVAAAARRSPLDLDKLANYNRAASGWGQSKGFYRPVTFNKPKVVLAYSDF